MAHKVKERERLRAQRVEAERAAASEDRRRRIVGLATAGVLVAAMVAAIVIVVAAGGGSDGASDAGGAFGPHYDGLAERRAAAGVGVMSDPPAEGAEHIHPELSVFVRGDELEIPLNVGIDPSQPPEQMAGLHTHDGSGVIHVENAASPTLGQFFEVWGVPFSADRLGPHEAKGDERVRLWVDGEPSTEFGDLVLEDGQQVVVAFGSSDEVPADLEP